MRFYSEAAAQAEMLALSQRHKEVFMATERAVMPPLTIMDLYP
jgi:hypothetical protein